MKGNRDGNGIEHARGHHFADSEKQVAHHVAERLLVMGILRKKLNEGSFHVYVDPRKLREVWAIINLEWRDERVFGYRRMAFVRGIFAHGRGSITSGPAFMRVSVITRFRIWPPFRRA